ncbi:MAG TPA: TOBE domain-containing protein [Nitrososphaerales archaeon]|nr:TOBE domain-containing protein [Nitrososphaerales archaeon]HUK75816.1 TOBE domain-containing protein [Nitrososphaerales archaeon]
MVNTARPPRREGAEKRRPSPLKPVFRLWMEDEKNEVVLDQTDALILRRVGETYSLKEAAKEAGISYRNAWDRVKAMEEKLHRKLVETKVGGRTGGSATLTEDGRRLLKEFRKTRKLLFDVLEDEEAWEDVGFKLSARNRLRATVVEVKRGAVTSQVKMRLSSPSTMTSVITNDAVEDLSLAEGDEVEAIVKSTDVLVAKGTHTRAR